MYLEVLSQIAEGRHTYYFSGVGGSVIFELILVLLMFYNKALKGKTQQSKEFLFYFSCHYVMIHSQSYLTLGREVVYSTYRRMMNLSLRQHSIKRLIFYKNFFQDTIWYVLVSLTLKVRARLFKTNDVVS